MSPRPPLDTVLFFHPGDSAQIQASSCVAPSPVHLGNAHEAVVAATQYARASRYQVNTLTFPELNGDPNTGLAQVYADYRTCARCHLCNTRFAIAHYRGNPEAAVVFLGEGPGKDENDLGQPFIGRSGKLQDCICKNFGIEPDVRVFWMNLIGCRAAKHWESDRVPIDPEMIACAERVWMMLQAIRPRVVVCLGKTATRMFWDTPPNVWSWNTLTPPDAPHDAIIVGYAYHPAYLVRVIGAPSMYREYAACRTFFGQLAPRIPTLTKVSKWRFFPRYAQQVESMMVAAHDMPGVCADRADA